MYKNDVGAMCSHSKKKYFYFFCFISFMSTYTPVRQAPVLLHVAGRPKSVMGDAEVKDQTPAPGLISKIVTYLHIAEQLACACRHFMLCAHDVSGRAEQQPEHTQLLNSVPFMKFFPCNHFINK